ncbi:secretin N-terminal domain-containing protein [Thermogutta sp.]|uniref:secretin N-terminal domain-containing protein n=1 Tax=Thermogutta sp. TaxID=1962930 RepID=UPI003C7E6D6F
MQIAELLWRVCGGALPRWMAACIGLLLVLVCSPAPSIFAAEYEVVGALAYAVEPDVAKEIGLTENQLKQLNDLINNAEAEILTTLSELKDLSPQERNAKLAEFRRGIEDRGLALLSTQQRAKLEQIRMKRLGEKFFTDPVIAQKLGLTEEQKAALAKAVAERSASAKAEGASENPAIGLLSDNQRKTLRAMLMGELVKSEPSTSEPVSKSTEDQDQSPSPAQPVVASTSENPPPAASGGEHPAEMHAEGSAPVAPPASEASQSEGPPQLLEGTPAPAPGTQPASPPGEAAASPTPAPTLPTQPAPQGTVVSPPAESEGSPGSSPPPSVSAPLTNQASPSQPARQPSQTEDHSAAPTPSGPNTTPEVPPPVPAPSPPSPGAPTAPQADTQIQVAHPATQPPSATQESQFPQLPPRDVKLRFNFRYQPWKDVLEWLAQQAGLSLVMDAPPPGTFNYVDDHEFTPAEAIDLLNSVLLTKGYVLIRRERMLMLLNIEDGVPSNLVDRVTPEELDSRGDYEMVSCLFQLRKMTPEEAEQEVKKLLGPQGSVVVLAKARQILVTETAGRLKTIRRMIDAIENPDASTGTVRTFKINPYTVDQVLSIIRQMFQIPPDQTATPDGSLRFALDPSGSRILVTGTPESLDRFAEVLKALDPSSESPASRLESTPQLEVYPITSADPQMVLQVLQTLLAGMPDVRIAIDPKTGALVAWARPAQHATIRATLQQMQGEVGQVEVIPLRVVDPQLAVLAINKLFGGSAESPAANAPTVDADMTTRMLLVRGTKAQIEQIKQLLIKMGEPSADGPPGTVNLMRTIPMDAATARAVLEQVQNVWPQFRGNRLYIIRSVVPSESNSSPSQGSSSGANTGSEGSQSNGIESTRIPLPLAAVPARRLVLGLNSGRTSSSSSTTTQSASPSSSGSSTPSSQPQPGGPAPGQPGGQPPFFRPWGWGPPGGFFERRGDWNRDRGEGGDRGEERQRNRDWSRSTFWEGPQEEDEILTEDEMSQTFAGLGSSSPMVRIQLVAFVGETETPQAAESSAQPAQAAQAGEESARPASSPSEGQSATGTAQSPDSAAPPSVPAKSPPASSALQAAPATPSGPSGADAAGSQPGSGAPPIIVAVTPEGLVIASQDPEALNQFEDLVRRMVSNQAAAAQQTTPELVVYYLKHSKAEVVASTLDQILGGGTLTTSGSTGGSLIGEIARAAFGEIGGGLVGSLLGADTGTSSSSSTSSSRTTARVQVTPDSRLNALIVQGYPQDLQLIEEILRVLDQPDSPQDVAVQPKTVIIPVKNTQAEEIAQILRTVYQDRLVTAAGANRPPSPQEIIQLLRGGRGGSGGRTQPQQEQEKMSIGVDTRTNSLIVSAPERLLNEVRQLVEQLDQKAMTDSEETTEVVTLHRTSAESVSAALSALLGSGVQIRGGSSSRGAPTTTSTSTPSSSNRGSQGGFPFGGFRGFGGMPFGGMPFGGFTPFGNRGGFSSSGNRGFAPSSGSGRGR